MAIKVEVSFKAQKDIDDLDTSMKPSIEEKIAFIGREWPNIARKPLAGPWRGHFRIQVRKDWRVIIRLEGGGLTIARVFHRSSRGYDEGGSRDMSKRDVDSSVDVRFRGARERGMAPPPNRAAEYVRFSLGQDLYAARRAGKLTQQELARRVGRAQSTVSMAEKGQISVSTAYVVAVLKACGVPANWNRRHWEKKS